MHTEQWNVQQMVNNSVLFSFETEPEFVPVTCACGIQLLVQADNEVILVLVQ